MSSAEEAGQQPLAAHGRIASGKRGIGRCGEVGQAERQVRVTFFVCGYRIAEFPDTLSHIAAAGHEIGLHSSNHDYMQKMDYGTALRDLTGCAKAVEDACGVRARLFRPPGGLYGDTLLKAAGDAGLSVILRTRSSLQHR